MQYYLKLMESAVVKQQKIFDYYETTSMINKYEIYRAAYMQSDTLATYSYDVVDFKDYTFINTGSLIRSKIITAIQDSYENLYRYLSKDDQESLLLYKREKTIREYVEENKYVRMLNGEPPLEDVNTLTNWYTHTDGTQRNKTYLYPDINFSIVRYSNSSLISKPVHELGVADLVKMGIWDAVYEYGLKGLSYLRYLKRKSGYIKSREAKPFELLYIDIDVVDYYIYQTFNVEYEKSRKYFIYTLSNEFYESYHQYYEQMVVLHLLSSALFQTMIKFSNGVSEIDYSNEDIMKTYFKSVGIDYVSMPTLYMNRFIEKINTLVSMKGTKDVLTNICEILDVANVYRYVLRKVIKTTEDFDENTPVEDKFALVLHKVPITSQSIQDYISTATLSQTSFEGITSQDKYFGSNREEIIQKLKGEKFSAIATKYIAIENAFELTSVTYKLCGLLRVIINNHDVTNNPLKSLVSYNRGGSFDVTLFDGIMYLIYLIVKLRDFEDVIPDSAADVFYVIGYNNRIEEEELKGYRRYYKNNIAKDPLHAVMNYIDVSTLADDYKNIEGSSNLDFYEFISSVYNNDTIINQLEEKLYQTDDYAEYSAVRTFLDNIRICKSVKSAFGTFTTYEDYLNSHNQNLILKYKSIVAVDDEKKTVLKEEIDYMVSLLTYTLDGYKTTTSSPYVSSLNIIKTDYIANFNDIVKSLILQVQSLSVELIDGGAIYNISDINGRYAMLEEHNFHTNTTDNESVESDIEFYKHEELTIEEEYVVTNRISLSDEGNGITYYKED